MRGVADWTVRELSSASALDPAWARLAASSPVQSNPAWLLATEEAALPPTVQPLYLECRDAAGLCALLPLAVTKAGLSSLTTPYSTLFQPILRPELNGTKLRRIGAALGQVARRFGVTRLDALDPAWPPWQEVIAGAAEVGLVPRSFAHFGNCFESVSSWDAYLAARPGALRETIRRKTAAASRDQTLRLEEITELPALGPALLAYNSVYARSWKEPEPFPAFNAALLPRLADLGVLRMGLMWADDNPIAAQYWTVWKGVATVLKLAHDDRVKSQSPGTVLTAWMIRRLIERDYVHEIDFGRGDDPYKQSWVSRRRQRTGTLLIYPMRATGLAALARQAVSRVRRVLG